MKNITKTLLTFSAAAFSMAGASATISFSFSTGTPSYQPVYRAAPVCRNVVRYDFFGQPYWAKVCNTVRRTTVVPAPVTYPINTYPVASSYVYDDSYNYPTYGNTVYYTTPTYTAPSTTIRNPQNNATRVNVYPTPVRLR